MPPLQSSVQLHPVLPSHVQTLGAQPVVASQVWPSGQPRRMQPTGGGAGHPAAPQRFPKQHDGSPGGHQSQQNAPA